MVNTMTEPVSDQVEAAQAELDAWDKAHAVGSIDPGMQSMRFHETQAKRDKDMTTYLNRLRRESREREALVTKLAKAKKAAKLDALPKEPVNPSDLAGAVAVFTVTRYRGEWHRVVRVNKTTVTCWAPPGFDQPRIPHGRIYKVRHATEEGAQ